MERWSGKTAVVTGASAGIGAAVAVQLADAGLRVVGIARRANLIDNLKTQVKGPGSIVSLCCDLTKVEDISKTFQQIEEQFGGVDVLVNNAGVFLTGNITDVGDDKLTDSNINSMIDLNFRAVIMCTRLAVASMKKRAVDGHIVIVNSLAGHYEPFSPSFNIYPATKHALTAFTKALLSEFANCKNNIKVTSVSPGLVATDMVGDLLSQQALPALQPADVAATVLYAISTPKHVNISELTVSHIGEIRL